jgi:hypothetical protein
VNGWQPRRDQEHAEIRVASWHAGHGRVDGVAWLRESGRQRYVASPLTGLVGRTAGAHGLQTTVTARAPAGPSPAAPAELSHT